MAHYRKIDTRVWNDAKFRALSNNGKLVFFFLLTHPGMTAIGAMRGSVPGLAAELGWTPKAFSEAFSEALSKGMARHDESACVVWLPNFIRYNAPENPNVLKAWGKALDLLPECAMTTDAIQSVKAFAEGLSKAFREALPEAFSKGMPKQEQEQEQEQELVAQRSAPSPKGSRIPSDWALTTEQVEWALGARPGWNAEQVLKVGENFRDHWTAASGRTATKLDWGAAWRVWVRSEYQGRNSPSPRKVPAN